MRWPRCCVGKEEKKEGKKRSAWQWICVFYVEKKQVVII